MRLTTARLSIRSVLALVVLAAVWIALVREIETEHQRNQIASLTELESLWLDDWKNLAATGSSPASSHRKHYDDIHAKRLGLEHDIAVGSIRFSFQSLLFTIFYLWGVILLWVIRTEQPIDGFGMPPDELAAALKRRFVTWLKLCPVAPLVVVIAAVLFKNFGPSLCPTVPWCVFVIDCLLLIPLVHTLVGVVVCREMRWPAFLVGIVSTIFGSFAGLIGLAAVFGDVQQFL